MKIIRGETSPDYDPNGPFLNGNKGDSFMNENHKIMVEALGPGPGLLELNNGVLNQLAKSLNETGAGGRAEKVGLYKWMRDVLTMATAESLYGAHNPVADDPSLTDSLWYDLLILRMYSEILILDRNFEEDMALLMLQFLPTLLVPAAYRGRAAIKAAFTKFYSEKHQHTSSSLIRTRHASAEKWGFTADDIANFEISTLFLAVTNTVPTSFWLFANILADPGLLEEVRKEVGSMVKREKSADGQEEAVMDIAKFQSHCPLLLSSFRETLRLADAATSVRSITQDVQLTSSSRSSYLLKKGNVIQLPSGITHNNPAIWGSEPRKFNPRRFLPETLNALPKDIKKVQTQGYFPFGGGRHLCPGRHFATTEILAFVGAMVIGYVVEGAKVPEMKFQKLGTAVRKPAAEVQVNISKREGWEDVRWRFDTGEGKVDFKGLVGEAEE
jgi:cytochrome P450